MTGRGQEGDEILFLSQELTLFNSHETQIFFKHLVSPSSQASAVWPVLNHPDLKASSSTAVANPERNAMAGNPFLSCISQKQNWGCRFWGRWPEHHFGVWPEPRKRSVESGPFTWPLCSLLLEPGMGLATHTEVVLPRKPPSCIFLVGHTHRYLKIILFNSSVYCLFLSLKSSPGTVHL